MSDPIKTSADHLVAAGCAEDTNKIPYGSTKQTTYEVFVNGEGWQLVNPFGNETHSKAQYYALQDYATMMDALDK